MKYAKRYTSLIAAAAATALMAACGQNDDTVGQTDQAPMTSAPAPATTTTESALNQPVAPAQEGMNNQQNQGAGEAIAEGANDMAITAKVQAALAADGALSVMDIDVDTEAGRVELTGAAPDESARERATSLVTAVDGVVAVDNRLVVKKDS